MRIPTHHPCLPWLFRHVSWLRDRFFVDQRDQRTACQGHYQRLYQRPLVQFGECVLWKDPHKQRFKYEANWGYGVHLGRSMDSEEHLVAARTAGVVRCKTIRRRPVEDEYDQQMLLAMQDVPWMPREDWQQRHLSLEQRHPHLQQRQQQQRVERSPGRDSGGAEGST
eukprot:200448-Amphidinium_carterae.5